MSERFTLANREHLETFLTVLVVMGSACPACGHGTRRTSKRWARCKNPECGERTRYRSTEEMDALMAEAAERHREGEGGGR